MERVRKYPNTDVKTCSFYPQVDRYGKSKKISKYRDREAKLWLS